jgi:uncharacterized protein
MPFSLQLCPVGRVVGLWRYPVKSMAAQALDAADVSWFGLAGDRRWAFVRAGMAHSGFPWFTLREHPGLNRYRPCFAEPERCDTSATLVQTPDGRVLDVTDPALAAELSADGVQVMRQQRGVFDTFPLSLISTQTIASLGSILGQTLEVQRFRPNFLIECSDEAAFPEDEWLGQVLRIGGLRLRVDKRDGRCAVITLDPQSGSSNPAVLREVAQQRQGCLGVYGSTVAPGRVSLGDAVWVERAA